MINRKLLGDLVKEERLRRNLSQNALAEQAQISLRTVSDIETYNGNPQWDTLCSLASFLNISLDSIILKDATPIDTTLKQIMAELSNCTPEEKQIALRTLQGLIAGLRESK